MPLPGLDTEVSRKDRTAFGWQELNIQSAAVKALDKEPGKALLPPLYPPMRLTFGAPLPDHRYPGCSIYGVSPHCISFFHLVPDQALHVPPSLCQSSVTAWLGNQTEVAKGKDMCLLGRGPGAQSEWSFGRHTPCSAQGLLPVLCSGVCASGDRN